MIYYVEDDRNIRDLTIYALRQSGMEARGFADGPAFLRAVAERRPDAVLLDIMLPGMDGLQLLSALRGERATAAIPVMMITARDELLREVWGWDFSGGTRTVDVHVQTLRAKLGAWDGAITTLRGVGYRLDAPRERSR